MKKIVLAIILSFFIIIPNIGLGIDINNINSKIEQLHYIPSSNEEYSQNIILLNKFKSVINKISYTRKLYIQKKLVIIYNRIKNRNDNKGKRIKYIILKILSFKNLYVNNQLNYYKKTKEVLKTIGGNNSNTIAYIDKISTKNNIIKGTYKPNNQDYSFLKEIYNIINNDSNEEKIIKFYNNLVSIYVSKKEFQEGYNEFILSSIKKYIENKYDYAIITYQGINKKYIKIPSKYLLDKEISYNTFCNKYKKYCNLISFQKTEIIDKEEKINYSAHIIYLLKFLEKNIDKNFIYKLGNNIQKKTLHIYIIGNKKLGKKYGYAKNGYEIYIFLGNINHNYRKAFEILTHELGHIVDLGYIQGKSNIWNNNYQEYSNDKSINFYKISWKSEKVKKYPKPKNKRWEDINKHFVSGYGENNIYEDFAESFNMYVNKNKFFKLFIKKGGSQDLQKKYNYINNILHGHYLYMTPTRYRKFKDYPHFIPLYTSYSDI